VTALYATIWISLLGLLIGEFGRHRHRPPLVPVRLALTASAAGLMLGVVHSLLALAIVYDWNHDTAAAVTAQRAATVYRVAWTGSIYVNYVFLAWWAADLIWWWRSPETFARRPVVIEWLWRLLTFTMVVNGAVVFASPAGRIAGVLMVTSLLVAWWPAARPAHRRR
jgi:hypothetical protein